jgi:hypothetical protein
LIKSISDLYNYNFFSTPSRFSSHNVDTMLNVKRVKNNMQLAFIEKLFTNQDWNQHANKIFVFHEYVVREQMLLLWHQLCLAMKNFGLVSMWQHRAWNSVRCVEKRAICKEALSRLRFGEDKEWWAFAPCLSKYTES